MESALARWQQAMQLGVRTLHSGDVTAAAVAFTAATSHLPERPEAWGESRRRQAQPSRPSGGHRSHKHGASGSLGLRTCTLVHG